MVSICYQYFLNTTSIRTVVLNILKYVRTIETEISTFIIITFITYFIDEAHNIYLLLVRILLKSNFYTNLLFSHFIIKYLFKLSILFFMTFYWLFFIHKSSFLADLFIILIIIKSADLMFQIIMCKSLSEKFHIY